MASISQTDAGDDSTRPLFRSQPSPEPPIPPALAFSVPPQRTFGSLPTEPNGSFSTGLARSVSLHSQASFEASIGPTAPPSRPLWSFGRPIPYRFQPNAAALLDQYPYGQLYQSPLPLPQQQQQQKPLSPPIFQQAPSSHWQQPPTPGLLGVEKRGSTRLKLVKPVPKVIQLLVLMCFLELVVCAPLSVFYSYYLWFSAALLMSGPLAASLAMAALFLAKWGCCGTTVTRVKRFKMFVTIAAVISSGGAIIVPLVMYGVTCPSTLVLQCDYDKHNGEKMSVVAAIIMGLQAIVCIFTRFRAKRIEADYFDDDVEDILTEDQSYRPPAFPNNTSGIQDLNRSFTAPTRPMI